MVSVSDSYFIFHIMNEMILSLRSAIFSLFILIDSPEIMTGNHHRKFVRHWFIYKFIFIYYKK